MSSQPEPLILRDDSTITIPGGEGRWPVVNERREIIGEVVTTFYGYDDAGNPQYYTRVRYETHFDDELVEHLGWTPYRTVYLNRELQDALHHDDHAAADEIRRELERRERGQS